MTDKLLLRSRLLTLRSEMKQEIAAMVRSHAEKYSDSSYEELAAELGMSHTRLISYLKMANYSRPRGRGSDAYKQ